MFRFSAGENLVSKQTNQVEVKEVQGVRILYYIYRRQEAEARQVSAQESKGGAKDGRFLELEQATIR